MAGPLEPSRDDEAIAAVATLAAHDRHATPAARQREAGQRLQDAFGRAAAGVFHERGAGQAGLADRALIDPAHLVGGEDR